MQTKTHHTETLYVCPTATVTVVRKSHGLGRFPQHSYACCLYLLRPEEGTRVRVLDDGTIEFMPSFNELKSMFAAIEPTLAQLLPETVRNKPESRRQRWNQVNRRRRALRE